MTTKIIETEGESPEITMIWDGRGFSLKQEDHYIITGPEQTRQIKKILSEWEESSIFDQ